MGVLPARSNPAAYETVVGLGNSAVCVFFRMAVVHTALVVLAAQNQCARLRLIHEAAVFNLPHKKRAAPRINPHDVVVYSKRRLLTPLRGRLRFFAAAGFEHAAVIAHGAPGGIHHHSFQASQAGIRHKIFHCNFPSGVSRREPPSLTENGLVICSQLSFIPPPQGASSSF